MANSKAGNIVNLQQFGGQVGARPAHAPTRREPPERREPLVPNNVLGMLVFVITEMMFFSGLISAYTIGKGAALTPWPPPGQPRLPLEETLLNSLALLISGAVLWLAGRAFKTNAARAQKLLLTTIVLGAFFVFFQGIEWVGLISEGLTMTVSTYGSFFYLIVGTHALHAVGALGALSVMYARMRNGRLEASSFWSTRIFWYFVVGVWPVLYVLVYL